MNKDQDTTVHILLVEDNPDDTLLTRMAFEEGGIDAQLHVVEDGDEAIKRLNKTGKHTSAPSPHLVLLDLNLPRMSGLEVLEKIKNDPRFKTLPVIILTTSANPQDVRQCYGNHANGYLVKPGDLETLIHMMQTLYQFWFKVVTLAPGKESL